MERTYDELLRIDSDDEAARIDSEFLHHERPRAASPDALLLPAGQRVRTSRPSHGGNPGAACGASPVGFAALACWLDVFGAQWIAPVVARSLAAQLQGPTGGQLVHSCR